MIKIQKPEEIGFAFAAACQDMLFILSQSGPGKSFTSGSVQGGFLQAKPHPQPLNSK